MRCPRCNNEDESYFFKGSKGYYCRKCIRFRRRLLEEDIEDYQIDIKGEEVFLDYDLSEKQELVSEECARLCKDNDVLLHCVCGAGKTEIVLKSISEALASGKKVCYAISRKQVVLEIGERFREIFREADVVVVCGGHSDVLYGDIIVCTTHQLYRYEKQFDLLILDECDAFPFKGNEVLQNIAANSVRGHIIYSTATVDKYLEEKMTEGLKVLELNERYHGHDLPVPKQVFGIKLVLLLRLVWIIREERNQLIVFLPTIRMSDHYYTLFRNICNCDRINSETKDKQLVIERFRSQKTRVIFATTVLERGVTFKGIDVVIMYPEHFVFDLASLVQMSGRVGRKAEKPDGEVIFLQNAYSKNVQQCIRDIEKANRSKVSAL